MLVGGSKSGVYAHDVAKATTTQLSDSNCNAAVLSLGVDGSGRVWMGHKGGLVQVWCTVFQSPICQWSQLCPTDIR